MGISPDVLAQINATQQQAPAYSSGLSPMNPYNPQDAAASQAQMAAINAAGPDVFDKAMASVRDSRRALLESIAGAGSAGRAEYQRQAEQSAASRQAAVSAALASAQQRGNTDAGTLAVIQSTIGRPYDEGTSARDASSANWSNLFAAIGGANDAYMGKYEASLPIIQQQFKNDLATNFATTRADAQREIAKGKMSTDLQLSQLNLTAAEKAQAARQRQQDQQREDAIRLQQWQREDAENALEEKWRQKEFDENVREYGLDYALKQQQLARSGSGGGGGGGGFQGTGYDKGELQSALPGQISALRNAIDPRNIFGSSIMKIVGADKLLNTQAQSAMDKSFNMAPGTTRQILPKYKTGITWGEPAKLSARGQKAYNDAADGFAHGVYPQNVAKQVLANLGDTPENRKAIEQAAAEQGIQLSSGPIGGASRPWWA
jgi:hypothetical protein